jgi:hypothetical protein
MKNSDQQTGFVEKSKNKAKTKQNQKQKQSKNKAKHTHSSPDMKISQVPAFPL